ncbi:MAG: hypothetical protein Q8R37_01550 [Nanoarchaeota archaeon]|nr:hypothetical protein [Nanoarchaeota archaeon]
MDDYYFCKDIGLTENDLMEFADLKCNHPSTRYNDALQSLREQNYGENEVEISRYISEHLLRCQDCHRMYDRQKEGVRAGNCLQSLTITDEPSLEDALAGVLGKLKLQRLEDIDPNKDYDLEED